MTNKERFIKAFSGSGEMDRAPFEPGLDYDTVVDLSGLDFWQFSRQGRTYLSEVMHLSERFGFDVYHYAGDIPVANPGQNVEIIMRELDEEDLRIVETNILTSKGKIQQLRRYPRFGPEYSNEKFVKNIDKDWPIFREYFGMNWRIGENFYNDYNKVGNQGVVGVVVHSPIDFWQEYRHGGVEQMLFDCLDSGSILREFCEYYLYNSVEYIKKVSRLDIKPDFVMIHGSCCSASLISPPIFKNYVLPYLQEISAILKDAGILSLLHICGRSNDWLDMIAYDTNINVIDALEKYPYGNVDLSRVKKKYGTKLCLKGNVAAIVMATGTRQEVREEVKRCIDQAAEGGGFVLAVGDSIGPKGKLENIEEFVVTALEYGKY
ncbi:MAG: uroporphyrinogen decarboxylase family protein [Phycisphaerae bacterium]|jgi:uroporphyrinogen decarboxylase